MKTLLLVAFWTAVTFGADGAFLWKDPGPVRSLDLAGGPLGAGKAPQPPFKFVSEDPGGTSAKVNVTDARGANWTVKFGEEVKAENFASRILWAAGYYADPTYFVAQGTIENAPASGRAAPFIKNGQFRDARFELRDPAVGKYVKGSSWSLDAADLKGTKELSGLKVLFVLLGNWDAKSENNAIVETPQGTRYAVTDWGASMGRASDISGRSKWDCDLYSRDSKSFIDGAEAGFVEFRYDGKQASQIKEGIRREHAAWLMERLGKLSDAQIDAALQASGATADEKSCFAAAFKSRLAQLKSIPAGTDGVRSRTVTTTTTTTTTTVP